MGIQSSVNKFELYKKFPQTSHSSIPSSPSSPLDTKIEHLETVLLVWFKKSLREYVTYFVSFDDINSCEQWIHSRDKHEKILLITSGRFGKRIIPNIHQLTSIIGIYIFCWKPEEHFQWTQNYSKVRKVLSKEKELIQQLSNDQRYFENIEDSKSIQIFKTRPHSRLIDQEYSSIIWYQLFIQILLSPSYLPSLPSPKQFIDFLRQSISNDEESLNLIKQFELTYKKENAIKWLIDNTPIARFLNKALREQNIEILFYLRFFLNDLNNYFVTNQSTPIHVYRKQQMSRQKLENLRSNVNNHLMLNNFLITRSEPLDLTSIDNCENGYENVFIEIDAEYHDGCLPFTKINNEETNDMSVIFMCGSIFKIISLEPNVNSSWTLKLSLSSNREFDLLNENLLKLRQTKDFLMINQFSDQSNIYNRQLLRQFPPNDPFIHQINNQMNTISKVDSISLTCSKFVLIDLTKDNLSELSMNMLNTLQSITNKSILILKDLSELNFNEMSNKTLFIFTTSRINSLMTKTNPQPTKYFILEEEKENNSEDLIFALADELYRCYIWQSKQEQNQGNLISSNQQKEIANEINKQIKLVYKTFIQNNQPSIQTETTIIWLKFNNKNDEIITNTQKLFENIVSPFLIMVDCQECYNYVCTDGFNQSIFLIIDDNYKEGSIAILQTLTNIKQIYRYNQSGILRQLTFDLISHFNQLANQCKHKKLIDNSKIMFSKARDLCQIIPKL